MKRKIHYGWAILAMTVLATMGSLGLGRFGYTVILPRMREGLGLGDGAAGGLAAANAIGYLLGSLLVGLLGGRAKKRNVAALSLVAGAAAMSLTGLARSFPAALAFRFLTGLAGAGANVTAVGLLSIWFAEKRRGFATGLAVGGSSLGLLAAGIALPPVMAGPEGWRWGWQALAAVAALTGIAAWIVFRESPRACGLEPIGSGLEPIGPAPERGTATPKPVSATNPHNAAPRTDAVRAVLRNADARLLCLIYFCYGFSYIVFSTFYVRYLVAEGGFTLRGASGLWAGIGAVSFLGGVAWGIVSDKRGRRIAFVLSFAILSACFLVFGIWKALPGYIAASAAFALTAWSVVGIMAAAVGDAMGDAAPAAFGIVTFCFGLGQAGGPFVAGLIADSSGSFSGAFVMAGAVAAAGALLSLLIRDRRAGPTASTASPR